MNELVERFMEMSKAKRIALWVFAMAFITFVFWQYFYSGKSQEYTQVSESVEKLDARILDERRRAKNLPKLREKVKELDSKLKFALQELPDKKEIPDLLASISGLAKDAGLEVQLFRPQAESKRDFYAEVPVAISVEGTYHQVATFFDEVGHLSRIVNINEISMRDPKLVESKFQVKTDCVATTFRYLDESERAQLEDSTEGGKKRRKK
jgi:type IV pilus assembly protein PilO